MEICKALPFVGVHVIYQEGGVTFDIHGFRGVIISPGTPIAHEPEVSSQL